eukprot:c16676_g1_i1.p1 GENE.c16676_g1_i1~~c16676_g1_i1.p1  ORF type:complete len:144 (+),score=19.69 c16676_g1_i1:86-517(+)
MIMHVMLSAPMPLVLLGFDEMIWSNISAAIREQAMCCSSRGLTNRTTSSFDMQSHTPSHAITMNSSSEFRSNRSTSGEPEMIWLSGGKFLFCLYLRSPNDRARFKLPFTRWFPVNCEMNPPAASMRDFSTWWCGLWSCVNSIT